MSNMSFSVAHWIQCLPCVQEVTYSNPVKDWRFFCFRLNSQKAVMLMSLLLVHKSTVPFLLSLYHKELDKEYWTWYLQLWRLSLNLQSWRYQVQYSLLPFFRQWIVWTFFLFSITNISKIIRLHALHSRSVLHWYSMSP